MDKRPERARRIDKVEHAADALRAKSGIDDDGAAGLPAADLGDQRRDRLILGEKLSGAPRRNLARLPRAVLARPPTLVEGQPQAGRQAGRFDVGCRGVTSTVPRSTETDR
jgi:hypothetical protein